MSGIDNEELIDYEEEQDVKLAVKLVHRSKTTTTAARVRSL